MTTGETRQLVTKCPFFSNSPPLLSHSLEILIFFSTHTAILLDVAFSGVDIRGMPDRQTDRQGGRAQPAGHYPLACPVSSHYEQFMVLFRQLFSLPYAKIIHYRLRIIPEDCKYVKWWMTDNICLFVKGITRVKLVSPMLLEFINIGINDFKGLVVKKTGGKSHIYQV